MEFIKNIFMSLGIGFLFSILQQILDSYFLIKFLENNLITILVALLAINSATLGIILTKIREIIDKNPEKADFSSTKKEMVISINEQIVLIVFSALSLTLHNSELHIIKCNPYIQLSFETLIFSCFIYAILILSDTAKSVFVLLDFKLKQ
ncbi:hypothetical protein CCZ01_06695 [Helicobacter monodelphidis]|uniref:hypothetical protein n=1 Tax=Helicobacter sp. 15-1451 TaxID=2004995 RepID=UPI000DCB893B|nr:hypothetical protein [Helicobacter sp. 15-1451]RAX57260.1 hypothetical protein CCZ01_06695 [Helicobacter sp. 15-1451]